MIEEKPNEMAEDARANGAHDSDSGPGSQIPQGVHTLANERSDSAAMNKDESKEPLRVRKASGSRTPGGKQRSKFNAIKHGIFSDIVLLNGESRVKYNSLLNGLREDLQPTGKLEEILVEDMATNRWRLRRLIQAEVAEIRKATDFIQWEHYMRERNEIREIGKQMAEDPRYEHELISRIENPLILQHCLDLLAELHRQFTANGFTDEEPANLIRIYGNPYRTNLGDNLRGRYIAFHRTAEVSEEVRVAKGYASRERCKSYALEAIVAEIDKLKRFSKALSLIKSQRVEIETRRCVVPESPALDRLLRYEATLDRSFDRTLSQLERLQRMRLGQPVLPTVEVRHSLS